jgi:hypothetical protein
MLLISLIKILNRIFELFRVLNIHSYLFRNLHPGGRVVFESINEENFIDTGDSVDISA